MTAKQPSWISVRWAAVFCGTRHRNLSAQAARARRYAIFLGDRQLGCGEGRGRIGQARPQSGAENKGRVPEHSGSRTLTAGTCRFRIDSPSSLAERRCWAKIGTAWYKQPGRYGSDCDMKAKLVLAGC